MSHYSSVFKYGYATLLALLPFMVHAQLNITIRQDRQPTCFGYTDAQVSAIVAGGTAPYAFAWSSGSNTPNSTILSGIGAGSYTVTVTDNGGLSAVQSFSVTQPTLLTAAPASVSGNACAATNENYAANATGGVAPYTYRWYKVANTTLGTAATQLFTNAGQYYVSVTDAAGCSTTKPLTVNAPLVATFDKNDVSCGGECDGSVMAVVTGGTAPYTYLWDFIPMMPPNNRTYLTSVMFPVPGGTYTCTITDGAGCTRIITGSLYEPPRVGLNLTITAGSLCTGNASIQAVGTGGFAGTKTFTLTGQNNTPLGTNTTGTFTNLGIGEYHLVVKDPNNCPKDTLFSIRDMSTFNVSAIKTDASCAGVNNGSATAQISGGNGPWRYIWSNGATSAHVVNLASGNYTVSVYDGLNCFKTASVTIGATSNLALTTTGINAACTSSNGSASVTVQNGTAPYTYAWSSGATTANATQLVSGSYVVTVTDANGCRMVSNPVVITATNALTATGTSNPAICTATNGSIQITPTSGTAPYNYVLNGSNNATGQFTNLAAGSYTVAVSDANGCNTTTSVAVAAENRTVTINPTVTNTSCRSSDGRIDLTAIGSTNTFQYTLSGTPAVTNTTGQFVGLAAGSYNVTVVDGNGCRATTAAAVSNGSASLTCGATTVAATCTSATGGFTVISGGGRGPYTYAMNGTVYTSPIFTGLTAGDYSITMTDANGCQLVSVITVPRNTVAVNLNVNATATGCTGSTGSVTASANGGTAPYRYTLNGVTNTSGIFTNLSAGNFNVNVTDANGCQNTVATQVTTNGSNITATAIASSTFCGSSNGSLTFTATGGTAPYNYTLNGVTNQNGTFTNLGANSYTVSITDATGCQSTRSAIISNHNATITATATANAANCNGSGSISVTATGGTAPYTYTLNGVSNTTGQFTGLAASATPYNVSVQDANRCNGTATALVNSISANITTTATSNAANCGGANGSIQATATGGTAPYTYTLNGVSNATGQFTGLAAAATAYTVSVRDANGCQSTALATVHAGTSNVSATATTTAALCNSATGGIQVTSTGGTAPYTYTLNGVSNTTGQFTGLAASATPYNVTVRDANGCTGSTSATVSGSSANITATATSTPAICTNNTGRLTITASGGNLPYTYATNGTSNTDGQFDRLAAGTYAVTITDANGCQSVQNQSVTATNPTITPTVNAANTTCTGNDGRITISAIGGTNSYRFELPTSNNTNGQFIGLAVGNYVVTVVDGNGCRATANATVGNGSNVVTVTSTTTPAICTNNNGVIVVTGAGGTAPYTYTLNGASNGTGRFENLAANSYSIEIVDAGNCRTTTNVTLPVNNMNVAATVTAGSATCRGNDGGLTVVATGGNGNFWYAVNGVSNTTGVFTGLTPGSYTVISTDGNGCQARSTGLIQDGSRLLNPTVQATTPAVCAGSNGTANLNVTGGTGNYSYVLNGVTNSTGLFTGLATGTYTATITDGTTCRTTVPVTIGATTSNVVLTSNRVGATSCTGNDGSIEVIASGGTSPYTYRLNTASNTTGQFSGLSANTYTITATDANGCTSTVSATVNAATGLLATTTDLQVPTCRNANGSFRVIPSNGTAPYTYRLGSQTNQTGVFTNLRTGDYVVTVTDANNCVTSLPSVNLQSIGSITAAVTTTPVRCTGDSVTIRFTDASTVSGGGTQFDRNWVFGNGYSGTANHLELTFSTRMANVRLIVTSTQGCADTIAQNLPVGLLEIAVQDTATNCQNTTVNVATTNNSLGAPVSYTWTPSHLIASGGNTATPSLNVGATRQMVYVSMTNGICTKTDSVVINPIVPLPVDQALVSNNADCANGLRVDFSNTNLNAGAYRWVFGDPANPTAGASSTNASYTYGSAGTYTALLIPAAACLDTIRRTFTIQSGSAVQLRTIPNYQTGVNFCDANITVQVRARTNATTVRWSTNRNFTDTIGTDTLTNIVPANGISTFYVEGRDARGCRTVDSTKLTDRSVGVDVQNNVGICTDGIGHLVAENRNSRDTLTIMWTPPTGVTVVKGQGELKPDLGGSGTGYVYGFFRNQWGCTKLDSAKVDMINISASLTARDTVVAKGDTTLLTVTPGAGGYTYNWNPNVTTSGTPILVKPDSTTTYYVIVTDTNGCKAMAKVLVKVYSPECKDPFIYIPNAFSPNSDGNNDELLVRGDNLKQQCYFAIYNRWGEIVFESHDKDKGWDGRHKDIPVCADVYGYYLRGTCKNGEPIFIKGDITVLK